jgi:putative transposase
MPITKELLDQLMKEYKRPENLFGEAGLLNQLKKALLKRALEGELTHHLGYDKHAPEGNNSGNSRNGHSQKRVLSKDGQFSIQVPRDRKTEFAPQIIKKNQRRFDGFDDKIISMYAHGMTTREIQAHLEEIYSVEVSPDFISTVTDSVLDEVREWQSRPLAAFYPILFFDALRVHVKQNGRVFDKSIYVALGVNRHGLKEILGLWAAQTEGAKFWLSVMTELANRGLKDVLIACVDGLKGLPEAIESVFAKTQVQLCIVHQVRNSLAFVSYKDRKEVAGDLRGRDAFRSRRPTRRVRREMEWALCDDRQVVAGEVDADHPDVQLWCRDSAGDLHDECDRVVIVVLLLQMNDLNFS